MKARAEIESLLLATERARLDTERALKQAEQARLDTDLALRKALKRSPLFRAKLLWDALTN